MHASTTTHNPSLWKSVENGLYSIQEHYNAVEAKVESILLKKLTPAQARLALDCIKAAGIALLIVACPLPVSFAFAATTLVLAIVWQDWFISDRKIDHILHGLALASLAFAGIYAGMGAVGAIAAKQCAMKVAGYVAIAGFCIVTAEL